MNKKSKTVRGSRQGVFNKSSVDNSRRTEQAIVLSKSLCAGEGLDFVHLEYRRETGGSGRVLRLYVDKPGGVTIDDCVNISRQLSDILDVEWDNRDSYRLEVSSPGLEHSLQEIQDFIRFEGKKIKVRLTNAPGKKVDLSGRIAGVDGNMVRLLVDEETINLKYEDIAQARLMVLNGDS